MDPISSDEKEVRRLLNLLKSLMRLLDVSNREVERRMGLNQGQVSRVPDIGAWHFWEVLSGQPLDSSFDHRGDP